MKSFQIHLLGHPNKGIGGDTTHIIYVLVPSEERSPFQSITNWHTGMERHISNVKHVCTVYWKQSKGSINLQKRKWWKEKEINGLGESVYETDMGTCFKSVYTQSLQSIWEVLREVGVLWKQSFWVASGQTGLCVGHAFPHIFLFLL